ncbi:unnamed protein product [Linum tenue]|uniref:Gnk2-homologous domain-containing protein n=1 Tax=Linum tenue TaxID=586396 RepID=A0AAV0JQP7_9ROSI|nr:unnamed protein product [Linum tenue]
MAMQYSASVFVLAVCIAAVTGDGGLPPAGTPLCSDQVYTAADSFAADIDLVLRDLPGLDSEFLPTIDVNVYSPDHHHPVAYGQRICTDAAVVCEPCFEDAHSALMSDCRNNHKAGGQVTLKSCFMRRGGDGSDTDSSEELEGLPGGTYCVWNPKKGPDDDSGGRKEELETAPEIRKKSKSTGYDSKRWKFRDLLYRSHSDGKDSFVFLAPKKTAAAGGGDKIKGRRLQFWVRRLQFQSNGYNSRGDSNCDPFQIRLFFLFPP